MLYVPALIVRRHAGPLPVSLVRILLLHPLVILKYSCSVEAVHLCLFVRLSLSALFVLVLMSRLEACIGAMEWSSNSWSQVELSMSTVIGKDGSDCACLRVDRLSRTRISWFRCRLRWVFLGWMISCLAVCSAWHRAASLVCHICWAASLRIVRILVMQVLHWLGICILSAWSSNLESWGSIDLTNASGKMPTQTCSPPSPLSAISVISERIL